MGGRRQDLRFHDAKITVSRIEAWDGLLGRSERESEAMYPRIRPPDEKGGSMRRVDSHGGIHVMISPSGSSESLSLSLSIPRPQQEQESWCLWTESQLNITSPSESSILIINSIESIRSASEAGENQLGDSCNSGPFAQPSLLVHPHMHWSNGMDSISAVEKLKAVQSALKSCSKGAICCLLALENCSIKTIAKSQ